MELFDYPRTIRLGDRIELQIRPLRKADQTTLHSYFMRLPADEVSRLKAVLRNFIKDKENNYGVYT